MDGFLFKMKYFMYRELYAATSPIYPYEHTCCGSLSILISSLRKKSYSGHNKSMVFGCFSIHCMIS